MGYRKRPKSPEELLRSVDAGLLDPIDRAIAEILHENGRESFRSIAHRIGVSEATVRTRYARLSATNTLQVIGVTNPLRLGLDMSAIVGVRTDGSPQTIAEGLSSWRETSYVVITAGQFDLFVEVACADGRELLELIGRIRELDGVVTTETFICMQTFKVPYSRGARFLRTGAHAESKEP